MFVVILTALAAFGSAVWFALNQPISGNRHTNAVASRFTLAISGLFLATGLIVGLAGLL